MKHCSFHNACHFLLFACFILVTTQVATAQNVLSDIFSDKNTTASIPFDCSPPFASDLIIQVSINGEPPLPFVLDTGSGVPLALSPWAAKKLKIPMTAHEKIDANAWLSDIKSFAISTHGEGGKEAEMFRVIGMKKALVMDSPTLFLNHNGLTIAGIVGVSMFAQGVVQIDFAARMIRAGFKPHKPLHISGAAMLPMHQDSYNHFLVSLQPAEGKPIPFVLDTGASEITLSQEAAARFHAQDTYNTTDVFSILTQQEERTVLLPSLPIGDLREPNLSASYSEKKKGDEDCLLGMNLLSRFRVTFDFPNKQVFFERRKDYKEQIRPIADNTFEIDEHDGKYFVSDLDADWAVDKAGAVEGDRILEADGVVLDGLPLTRVKSLVYGFADTTAHLVLERKGERKEVSYQRYGLQALIVYPPVGAGIGLEQGEKNKILINGIRKTSPAKEAALQVGDEIVAVNDKPASQMAFEAILTTLNAPEGTEVALEIKPKGQSTTRKVTLKSRRYPEAAKPKK